MSADHSAVDIAKRAAARHACSFVEDGMKVGLGTGSTARWLIERLGEMVRDDGLKITCVPTSAQTAEIARAEGLQVVTLDEAEWLDLTIDGADEIDTDLSLIKGGGGALLHEKIVATASDRMIVIADESKRVEVLGAFPLPVEVIPFGWRATRTLIAEAIAGPDASERRIVRRERDGVAMRTDEGNYILDLHMERIESARDLKLILNEVPGVVENGLFVGICDLAIIGSGDGRTIVVERDASPTRGTADRNLFSDLEM